MHPNRPASAVALARACALALSLVVVAGCERGAPSGRRVSMRMRPDCQFLVMPEECMEAVVVEAKPAKRFSPGWY